ncbi:MAG TPA: site-2 protease family protein [Candidatus Polarisedimenticolia bacterium]|nr:site-2 protease family protein [Candidatus Polarisedimenticolia bacterium]
MGGSFRLGTVLGIPIRVHFTFLILLAFLFFSASSESGPRSGLMTLLFILLLFGCVLLHELGHCVVALRFGVSITSITLYPFGGVALLTDVPREPLKEILIAIAGPVVNFILAGGLILLASLGSGEGATALDLTSLAAQSPLRGLILANLTLGAFNLLPAYPMDGGRILRGILATRLPYAVATRHAARIGKVFGALFVLGGIYFQNWWLPILGVFVYIGANSEERATLFHTALEGLTVRDLMVTTFEVFSPSETLDDALRRSLHTLQDDFPIVRNGEFLGVLTRSRMVEALRDAGGDQYVQGLSEKVVEKVSPGDSVREALRRMHAQRLSLLPVMDEDRFLGIVTLSGILRGASLLASQPSESQR